MHICMVHGQTIVQGRHEEGLGAEWRGVNGAGEEKRGHLQYFQL